MRTVAIIQARMNSTRFPGKVLADLCGKPVLKHVIDRVRLCRQVDKVAVALSREDDWEPIAGRCDEWGVLCHAFNVPEGDVLARYVRACEHWEADVCVRVCGDNPLIMPNEIDRLRDLMKWSNGTFAAYSLKRGVPVIGIPTGYFAEVIRSDCLASLDGRLHSFHPQREHVTQRLYDDGYDDWEVPSWYTTLNPPNAAIDTPEDLERVAAMLNTKGEVNDGANRA